MFFSGEFNATKTENTKLISNNKCCIIDEKTQIITNDIDKAESFQDISVFTINKQSNASKTEPINIEDLQKQILHLQKENHKLIEQLTKHEELAERKIDRRDSTIANFQCNLANENGQMSIMTANAKISNFNQLRNI